MQPPLSLTLRQGRSCLLSGIPESRWQSALYKLRGRVNKGMSKEAQRTFSWLCNNDALRPRQLLLKLT